MNGAVIMLARYHARQAVKRELYAQGIKLQRIEARDITIAANQYVEDHPEVMALAQERYRQMVASGVLRPPRKRKLFNT